ncbi:MAG: dihydrofolate reductase family protein [Chloroflexi bacterium]|uniref:dihydrofolate reductase family protein n=1 Tax=Candidatus Flexifilum breve TaxID=3140694 RepID=UPI003136B2C9|nr:dihydrofolate reductase family protein [Chloroflexota bacterium]
MSLDGVIENPAWTFKYWSDQIANFKGEETTSSDALLLGRVTYEGFAQAWPGRKDDGAEYFNGVRKYVVSNTPEDRRLEQFGDCQRRSATEVNKLKAQDGTNITVHGRASWCSRSCARGRHCARARLPVVLGAGQRLFEDGLTATLKRSNPLGDVIGLIYEPER